MQSSILTCPHCGQTYTVTGEQWPAYLGQLVPCSQCREVFRVGGTIETPLIEKTITHVAASMPPAGPELLNYQAYVPAKTSGMAVAGFVLGISSMLLWILTAIPGLICSIIAMKRTKDGREGGRGLAIAGLVLSCVGMVGGACLAAIIIPQFTTASSDARVSMLASQTQSIRAQMELYKLQHNDSPPTWVQMQNWAVFLQATDDFGQTGSGTKYGPYLASAPVNPLTGSSLMVQESSMTTRADGWTYNPQTGKVKPIVPMKHRSAVLQRGFFTQSDVVVVP